MVRKAISITYLSNVLKYIIIAMLLSSCIWTQNMNTVYICDRSDSNVKQQNVSTQKPRSSAFCLDRSVFVKHQALWVECICVQWRLTFWASVMGTDCEQACGHARKLNMSLSGECFVTHCNHDVWTNVHCVSSGMAHIAKHLLGWRTLSCSFKHELPAKFLTWPISFLFWNCAWICKFGVGVNSHRNVQNRTTPCRCMC